MLSALVELVSTKAVKLITRFHGMSIFAAIFTKWTWTYLIRVKRRLKGLESSRFKDRKSEFTSLFENTNGFLEKVFLRRAGLRGTLVYTSHDLCYSISMQTTKLNLEESRVEVPITDDISTRFPIRNDVFVGR